MPLLDKRPVGEGFLAVWRREESTQQLLSGIVLSPEETSYYKKIAEQPRRRKEWLTWHLMVREFLGPEVYTTYNPQGRPVLANHSGHISVSHSRELVVLYYRPEPCGVDIEDCGRQYERVSDRYISPEEWQLPGASRSNRFQALAWCAKETVYKYAAVPGLDFLKDMRIQRIEPAVSEIDMLLQNRETIRLKYQFLQGHCLVYTI